MGLALPQLSSSCCGCTLRTGSLIILWIYLVISILSLVVPPLAVVPPSSNSTTPATTTTAAPATSIPAIQPLDVWTVVVNAINLVVGVVGLYGLYKDLHLYLLPFLVWEAFYTLQQAARTIIADFTISVILGELIAVLILFYFWLVVYSHYRALKGSARPIQA